MLVRRRTYGLPILCEGRAVKAKDNVMHTQVLKNYRTVGDCCYSCERSRWMLDRDNKLRMLCDGPRLNIVYVDCHGLCDDFKAERWHKEEGVR